MRYKFLFFVSIIVLSLFSNVYAVPVINNVSVQSGELWIGETENIFVNCTESDNNLTVSYVYADISTATASFPDNSFNLNAEGLYQLSISTAKESIFNKIGTFDVNVFCMNNISNSSNSLTSFFVSNLTVEVSSIPSSLYLGDMFEVELFVKKDGIEVTSGVDLSLSIDGTNIDLDLQKYYDSEKGWVLRFVTDDLISGSNTISINVEYLGAVFSIENEISISEVVDFSIVDINLEQVSSGDDVSVIIKATDRGTPIIFNENQLSVSVDSTSISVYDLVQSSISGAYDLKFTLPTESAGKHKIKIYFNYENQSLYDSINVVYVVPVSGTILSDMDIKHFVDLSFSSSKLNKILRTDTNGKYSLDLPPDTYEVQIKDDSATLNLYDVELDTVFDDSIKYQYLSSMVIDGVSGMGVYYYGVASDLDYGSATMKIRYDESKIGNLNSIKVYMCSNWNTGNKICLSEWKTISSDFDSLRKIVTIEDASINAAYIVGAKGSLSGGATLNQDVYNINDNLLVTGLIQNEIKNIVTGATIDAVIESTSIKASAVSDSKGLFSLNIDNPKVEGDYTLTLTISKTPYISSETKIDFEVKKHKELSIVNTDVVRLEPGESKEVEFLIINTGEADFFNISISLKNVPTKYYQMIMPEKIDTLKESAEKSVVVYFDIPLNASKQMLSAVFEVTSAEFKKDQNFVLNILPVKNETVVVASEESKSSTNIFSFGNFSSMGMPTGNLSMFMAQSEFMSFALFSVFSIFTALFFRKRRLTNLYFSDLRKNNRNFIFELRKHIFGISSMKKYSGRSSKNRLKNNYNSKLINDDEDLVDDDTDKIEIDNDVKEIDDNFDDVDKEKIEDNCNEKKSNNFDNDRVPMVKIVTKAERIQNEKHVEEVYADVKQNINQGL